MTILKVVSGVVMIGVTFGIKPIKQFVKKLFFLFAITFLFGGVTYAVYIFLEKDILIYSNGIIYFDVDMTFLVICAVISYIVITLITKYTDKRTSKNKEYYVTIENNGKAVSCMGLMDTGNNLREPFSDYPVIMADKSIFNRVYSDESIRLIPISTVNGESIIRAFKPQKLIVGNFTTDKAYVGESVVALDEYKIILNINLEGEMNND
jgi:stage II sporulation protein GA (sporulation sigma-E factor processing peptidase)